jgi:hypothetical protein
MGCAADDVHLPAVHAKHPQPEVRLAGQFLGGDGPGTTLWTERSGQMLGEGSGLDFARGAGYVDRLLIGAWGHRRAVCCGVMGPASSVGVGGGQVIVVESLVQETA